MLLYLHETWNIQTFVSYEEVMHYLWIYLFIYSLEEAD